MEKVEIIVWNGVNYYYKIVDYNFAVFTKNKYGCKRSATGKMIFEEKHITWAESQFKLNNL